VNYFNCSFGGRISRRISRRVPMAGKLLDLTRKIIQFKVFALMLGMFLFSSVSQAQTAGLLSGGAERLPPITLSVGQPIAEAPYELVSGEYYRLEIVCDGSGELAIGGSDFFRNIWVDEVVINDIEVRPLGLSSLEFDDEGSAEIKFIAIRPGRYELRIPGTTGETQGVTVVIK